MATADLIARRCRNQRHGCLLGARDGGTAMILTARRARASPSSSTERLRRRLKIETCFVTQAITQPRAEKKPGVPGTPGF